MLDWLHDHQGLLWTLGAASVAVFIASLVIIPALVVRIRPDYFAHEARPQRRWSNQRPYVRYAIVLGKNLLGVILVLTGITLLILPGPGLLTLLVGLFLIDFPGKYSFEKWVISRRYVHGPINWLRTHRDRMPLQPSHEN